MEFLHINYLITTTNRLMPKFLSDFFARTSLVLKTAFVLKGISWVILLILFTFFGKLVDKLFWIDEALLLVGLISTFITLKHKETREELWSYWAGFHKFVAALFFGPGVKELKL